MLDAGCGMLDTEYRIPNTENWTCPPLAGAGGG
jgi:hypothetical protein